MSWTNRQKGILQMYRRYAGLTDGEYGEILYGVSGQRSSRAGELGQYQFDRVMALAETRAHLAEVNGCAVGKRPGRIQDWRYWRNRCPSLGAVTSRQLHKIGEWWEICCEWLPKGNRTAQYLLEVAEGACGRELKSLDGLTEGQARVTIEALKSMQRRLVRQANQADSDRVAAKYHKDRAARIARATAGESERDGDQRSEGERPAGPVQAVGTSGAGGLQWGPVGLAEATTEAEAQAG